MAKAVAETVTKTVQKEVEEKVITLQLSEDEARSIFAFGGEMNLDVGAGKHVFDIRQALAKHIPYTYFRDRFDIRNGELRAKPINI